MNKKILSIFPYVLVVVIIVYLLITYDRINRGIVEEGEIAEKEEKDLSSSSSSSKIFFSASFDGADKIEFPSDSIIKFEGIGSAKIIASQLFGPTFVSNDAESLKKIKRVTASFMAYSEVMVIGPQIIVSISNDKKVIVYQAVQLPQQLRMKEWTKMEVTFPIDNGLLEKESKLECKVYVMNPKNEVFNIDNFKADLWDTK
ncbi:MAG: hypothetical protein NT150_02040 [Bacteroidetes bacterium]|nr:hypothetical protein [Bacteroidota bacterium]